ncbi:MAG TPA: PIG-L deacetylase family protein [Eudoraea sp.]|nr:PIG-L deacetylase family protein [Eudoraea sp.]
MKANKLLVVGAHAADFVWRAGGTIAKTTAQGGEVLNLALSYGERGESGVLWKEDPKRSVDEVKELRRQMSQEASGILGCEYRCLDWGDYPMVINDDRIQQLADIIRDFAPNVILTHTERDPFNPDHPMAFQAVEKARLLSAGAGVAAAFGTINPPVWYSFEPHQPELSGFVPNTFVDITSVFEKKMAAMDCMRAQEYLQNYYKELGARRGNHARRISGKKDVRFAEAFQCVVPVVLDSIIPDVHFS